jgi:hypothetical protein
MSPTGTVRILVTAFVVVLAIGPLSPASIGRISRSMMTTRFSAR